MKKYIFILFCCVFMCGCKSIAHKGFFTVTHLEGGRTQTGVDPQTGQFMPYVFGGQLTNVLTTIPYGAKVKAKVTIWTWWCFWTDKKSMEIDMEIDATSEAITSDVIKTSIENVTK